MRHSKWLSFMKKRLILSRELLSDNGLIFISIDDKEYAYLKVIMDEVYGEENFLSTIIVKSLPNGRIIKNGFSRQHEYVLVYSKNFSTNALIDFNLGFLNNEDNKLTSLQRGGNNSLAIERPNRFYPILLKLGKLSMITKQEYDLIRNKQKDNVSKNNYFNEEHIDFINNKYEKEGFSVIWPVDSNNIRKVWQREYSRVCKEIEEGKIIFDSKSSRICSRPLEVKNPVTVMDEKDFAFSNGAKLLNKILGKDEENNPKFGYPKSLSFMEYIINLIQDDSISVLDFFGGSGTTAEAVMSLNSKDGGERRFVIVTNNDNDICEEVTLPRIYSVIQRADDNIINTLGIDNINNDFHKKYKENFRYLELKTLDKINGNYEELFDSEELYKKEFNSILDIDLISKGNK